VAFDASAFDESAFDVSLAFTTGIVFGHRLNAEDLLRFATALELASSSSTTAGNTREGFLRRATQAAENAVGMSSSSVETEIGYYKRLAVALEIKAGTLTVEENETYEGYIKRIVEALETIKDDSTRGTMEERLLKGADGIVL